MVIRAFISIVAALVTAAIFEMVLRLGGFMPQYTLQLKTLESDSGKLRIVLDERRLYRVKPRSREDINNYGYRDADFTVGKTGTRIVMLGDSYVMGNNLASGQTIPKQLERMLHTEVLNMGVDGYGPDQSLIALQEDVLKLNPDLVVLVLFAGNDLRDVGLNELFAVDERGTLREQHANVVTRALPATRLQMLMRLVFQGHYLDPADERTISRALIEDKEEIVEEPLSFESRYRVRLVQALLGEFKRKLQDHGVPFYAVIMPSWTAFDVLAREGREQFINERTLAEVCNAAQVPCLNLADALRDEGGLALYDPAYRHLNALGASKAAARIAAEMPRSFPQLVAPPQ